MNFQRPNRLLLGCLVALLCGLPYGSVASSDKKDKNSTCPLNELYDISTEWAMKMTSQVIDENPNQNVFIAPTSISMALSLLLMGAEGKTEDELKNALGYEQMSRHRKRQYFCHLKAWKRKESSPELTLGTASRLYTDDTVSLTSNFKELVRKNGNLSDYETVNFKDQPEEARNAINEWVSEQTNGHIDELFPAGSISSQTKLVLTSAIYFKGLWDDGFDDETYMEPFYLPDNTEVDVEYMFRSGMEIRFLENEGGIDLIELPYKQSKGGHQISMIVYKTNEYSDMSLKQVEDKMKNVTETRAIIERLHSRPKTAVDIKLPVITIKEEYDLKSSLTKMGMGSIFQPGVADFRNLDGSRNLYIDQVVHKTYFKMDQKGVEAAGATGLKILPMMMSPSFFATKPFYIFIYDHETKSVLFSGKIYNPSLLA